MLRSLHVWIALLAVLTIHTMSAGGNTGVVTNVVRGDIITIGESFTARLTGVFCPAPDSIEIGKDIRGFAANELISRVVRFFTWTTDNTAAGIVYDDDGYPFVTIQYGDDFGLCFNEIMISKGFAKVDTSWLPEDRIHYLDLERHARENHIGIWK